MKWEEKVEMCKMHNNSDVKVYDFILEKVKDFDLQAWDMLETIVYSATNIPDDFIEKMKPEYKKFKKTKKFNSLGFICSVRLEMMFGEDE